MTIKPGTKANYMLVSSASAIQKTIQAIYIGAR